MIDVNVIIEGKVVLGNHVRIGAGSVLKDCVIGDHTEVKPYPSSKGHRSPISARSVPLPGCARVPCWSRMPMSATSSR